MANKLNPWKILSQKKLYDNNWITVTEYSVINPSGGKGIYGKIHYKNIATGIVVLDEGFNTYLIGQFRFVLNACSWEIPEGGCDLHEEPESAAKRELMEEAGLKAERWQKITELYLSNSVNDEYAIIFLATGISQCKATPEETEQLEIKKLPFEEAYQMVKKGRITDALSVIGIQKIKLMMIENKNLFTQF